MSVLTTVAGHRGCRCVAAFAGAVMVAACTAGVPTTMTPPSTPSLPPGVCSSSVPTLAVSKDESVAAPDPVPGIVRWVAPTPGPWVNTTIKGRAVGVDATAGYVAAGNTVAAFDLADGSERWQYRPPDDRRPSLLSVDNDIMVAATDTVRFDNSSGHLDVRSTSVSVVEPDGHERWSSGLMPGEALALARSDSVVAVQVEGDVTGKFGDDVDVGPSSIPWMVWALDASTGAPLWRANASLAGAGGDVVVLGGADGCGLRVVDAITGELIGASPTPLAASQLIAEPHAEVFDGDVFTVMGSDMKATTVVGRLDAESGHALWWSTVPVAIAGTPRVVDITVVDDTVIVSVPVLDDSGFTLEVYAFMRANGWLRWTTTTDPMPFDPAPFSMLDAQAIAVDDTLLVTTGGQLWVLDITDGTLRSIIDMTAPLAEAAPDADTMSFATLTVAATGALGTFDEVVALIESAEPTVPSTTVERSTTTTSAPTSVDPAVAGLAQALPTIAGYSYGDILPFSFWDLGGGSAGMSRPVLADGARMAEVTVASAGSSTAEAWSGFVNDHHGELAVPGGESLKSGEVQAVVTNLGQPAWAPIDNELVLNAVVDPDWAGVWYHGGLVWGVSGPETQARVYAERLIEQQAVTGSEPEPEQTDIDVLEGPLAELAVEVPGFMYVDAPHQQVLDTLSQLGGCQDHLSQHTIHPADDPDPINTVDDDDILVTTTLWSDLPGCDRGQWFVTDLIENRGFVPVEGGAAASTDGTTIVWVAETGAMVQAIGADVTALESYRPVLEAIAEASSAFAGATPSSAVQIVVPGFEGPFEATGSAVDQGMVCGSGDVVTTSTTERGRADRLTVGKEFTCDDGSGTLSAVLQVQLYPAQGATFMWVISGGTGDYEDLQGSGSGFVEDPDTDIYQGRLRIG